MSLLSDLRLDVAANDTKAYPSLARVLKNALLHPGVQVLMLYRMEVALRRHGAIGKAVGRLCRSFSVILTSCHVSPNALIAPGVSIPHATGIVIGEGVVIEKDVRIYQQVTVGQARQGDERYPRIRRGTVLYAGAKIFGDVEISEMAVVAANAVVLRDIGPGQAAGGVPARILKSG